MSELPNVETGKDAPAIQINFKRVLDRIIRLWYIIAITLTISLAAAYLINRYSTRIYPVRASIIIKENEESAGAKFLYNNELVNPYRNFLNEIYIMKSYPLLQEVIEDLGFQVSYYREGEILTTEYYDPNFPIKFKAVKGGKMPYGMSMYFQVKDEVTFSLQYISDNDNHSGKEFYALPFNDTIHVNGFELFVSKESSAKELIGKRFVIQFNNSLALAKQYSARLSATWAALGASVVNLDINGPIAQKEIDFLNKFIERYQSYDVEKKNKVATMAMRFLEEQLVVIGDSLKIYEDQVENFKRRNMITELADETNRLYSKVTQFEDQKFKFKLRENYYSYITKMLQDEHYDGIFTPGSVGIDDPIVTKLINEVMELQTNVDVYRSNKSIQNSKDNPLLENALQRISFLKLEVLKTIDNSRKTETINQEFISDQIKLAEKQLGMLPSTERELIDIQRNYSLKENLYLFLLQKRTEAGLSKASTTSDIYIVNQPLAGGAIRPKTTQNYGIAASIGLLLPILFFIGIELANNRIQSKEDIEKITTVPFIGGVGHNVSHEPLIVYNKPRSALAESFRALRSNLNYFTGNKEHQVFMVTSSIPGEGKSFTTLNLATVFALAGKRTVILGADLRKPKLAEDLKLTNAVGLSQYLSGMASLEEVVQTSGIENLSLIAGGPMPPNPSELLLRPAMSKLISELRERFDFVVIDTPPLSFVADAFVLSTYADHTLYVIRQDFTPNMALTSLEEFYETGKFTNISILFNDLRKSGLGYGYDYGYGYGYGYDYGYKKNDKSSGYYNE